MASSNEIVFDYGSCKAALNCLVNMVELERTAKFGSLKNEYGKTNRYIIEENNTIDSRYYTDKATTLLFYAVKVYGKATQFFTLDMKELKERFNAVDRDLSDDSADPEKTDLSIIDRNNCIEIDDFSRLYAFYSGYELLDSSEEEEFKKKLSYGMADIDYNAILKKTEIINGVEQTFYYLSSNASDIENQLSKHHNYVDFLEERFSGDILKALSEKANGNDIIIASPECSKPMGTAGAAAYAHSDQNGGFIVINSRYYEDAICHEIGHIFDFKVTSFWHSAYEVAEEFAWKSLSEKYADEVYSIRTGADINAGYSTETMEEDINEFYAEAFQLYFYSPETRAALPEELRKAIEYELMIFAGEGR